MLTITIFDKKVPTFLEFKKKKWWSLRKFGYNLHIFSIKYVFLLIFNDRKFLVFQYGCTSWTGGYILIFNDGHLGSPITTHYSENTRCNKIWNIINLDIFIPWISYLNNSGKLPDTEAANDRKGEKNYSKPKAIRIFNVSLKKYWS